MSSQPLWRIKGNFCARNFSAYVPDLEDLAQASDSPLSGRVHILGLGNVGTFVAHTLASRVPRPPITLLFHRPEMVSAFHRAKSSVMLNINGLDDNKTGYDVEALDQETRTWRSISMSEDETKSHNDWHGPYSDSYVDDETRSLNDNYDPYSDSYVVDDPIDCLILCSKANVTYHALLSVKHRLTPDSTILIAQNGMGVQEMISRSLWPDPETRPHFMQAVISHGLASINPFHIAHNGVGTFVMSPVIQRDKAISENEADWALSTKYLIRLLTLSPSLVAQVDTPTGLLQYQLEKLAVNCIINPLTAIFDCENGKLLHIFNVTRLMRLLLFEISNVICALPELRGVPGVDARFAPERLRRVATQVMNRTSKNTSSMLQDVRRMRPTEIEYMNGWIVRRGEELGMKCVLNYSMKQMVLAKLIMTQRSHSNEIPLDSSSYDPDDGSLSVESGREATLAAEEDSFGVGGEATAQRYEDKTRNRGG